MSDVEKQVEDKHVEGTEVEEQKDTQEKKHKYDSKWDIIDKIKQTDEQAVVLNIFKVHPEATWKEIKEVYKEFQMKIDKVPNKEGMFNLHFRTHNDAINFIKVSPKPILDKKFLIRINDRIKKDNNQGWNEIGTDGHTSKHETMKYYKNKAKKNYNKPQDGENVETNEEKTGEEGFNLPTRTMAPKNEKTEEGAEGQVRTRKISNETRGPKVPGENKRFIGESTKPAYNNKTKAPETKQAETEKPVEKPVEKVEKKEDDWNTVKDPIKEKKQEQEAKKKAEKAEKAKKEKEAQDKKQTEAKQAQQTNKPAQKNPVSNFTDGWD